MAVASLLRIEWDPLAHMFLTNTLTAPASIHFTFGQTPPAIYDFDFQIGNPGSGYSMVTGATIRTDIQNYNYGPQSFYGNTGHFPPTPSSAYGSISQYYPHTARQMWNPPYNHSNIQYPPMPQHRRFFYSYPQLGYSQASNVPAIQPFPPVFQVYTPPTVTYCGYPTCQPFQRLHPNGPLPHYYYSKPQVDRCWVTTQVEEIIEYRAGDKRSLLDVYEVEFPSFKKRRIEQSKIRIYKRRQAVNTGHQPQVKKDWKRSNGTLGVGVVRVMTVKKENVPWGKNYIKIKQEPDN